MTHAVAVGDRLWWWVVHHNVVSAMRAISNMPKQDPCIGKAFPSRAYPLGVDTSHRDTYHNKDAG